MPTLKEARKTGDIEKFIREHEQDEPGDIDRLDAALKRPASQKSKEAPKASPRGKNGD